MAENQSIHETDLQRPLRVMAWIAATFTCVVGLVMLVHHLRLGSVHPLNAPSLLDAKTQLRANPADKELQERVRKVDQDLRRRFFRQLGLTNTGGILLVVGIAVFLVATGWAASLKRRSPRPGPRLDNAEAAWVFMNRSRLTTLAAGVLLLLIFLLVAVTRTPQFLDGRADVNRLNAALGGGKPGSSHAPAGPSLAESRANWPRFRGPDGTGVAYVTNAPTRWNGTNGENIVWKTEIKSTGLNSPVVWSNRVFLTGGNAAAREVLCFDAATGGVVWQKAVPPPASGLGKQPDIPESTGYAAASAATDGRRVFAVFATGELVAFGFDGNVAWTKFLGPLQNAYGHATSLLTWQERLIVQLDQADAEAGKSRLYALDVTSGAVIWERSRPVGGSWGTPIVIPLPAGPQIVTIGEPWVIGYEAASGQELWKVDCMGGDLAPSPVFADGLVFVASPYKVLAAIRPDGRGDVTKTHLAWSVEENVPDVTSPAATGEFVFTATAEGAVACLDAKSGAKVWAQELGEACHASPTIVGNRLYLFTTKGVGVVAEIAREFRETARNPLGEEVHASPAFVDERIYVRGVNHLFCIGVKGGPPPVAAR